MFWLIHWTPGTIHLGFIPLDVIPLDGITVTINSTTTNLTNWWTEVVSPYTPEPELEITVQSPGSRALSVIWWCTE